LNAHLLTGHTRWSRIARWCGWVLAAIVIYCGLVLLYRQNPWTAFDSMYQGTLGSTLGWGEVVEGMIPLIFCALAVSVPARIGQVNVGGEGQLWAGGIAATFIALTFMSWPTWLLIPTMVLAGAVGGGVWAGVPGWLKARGWTNEVFTTVLLNYVAILGASALVFGPWHDPLSGNFPQSREIGATARLGFFGSTGIDVSIVAAVVAVLVFDFLLHRTRWGLEIRAIGGNPNAAARMGVPVSTFIVSTMFIGGAIAGVAGMAQLSAVQLRLNTSLSPGYGYFGFLVSWLAGHNPRLIIPMAFLISVLTTAGTALQISLGLPSEMLNILCGAVMLIVLMGRAVETRMAVS
jgi:simple sugar transport system permease protein